MELTFDEVTAMENKKQELINLIETLNMYQIIYVLTFIKKRFNL